MIDSQTGLIKTIAKTDVDDVPFDFQRWPHIGPPQHVEPFAKHRKGQQQFVSFYHDIVIRHFDDCITTFQKSMKIMNLSGRRQNIDHRHVNDGYNNRSKIFIRCGTMWYEPGTWYCCGGSEQQTGKFVQKKQLLEIILLSIQIDKGMKQPLQCEICHIFTTLKLSSL